jgi:LPXTG-motif cell wall-anchored protein
MGGSGFGRKESGAGGGYLVPDAATTTATATATADATATATATATAEATGGTAALPETGGLSVLSLAALVLIVGAGIISRRVVGRD